MAQFTHKVNSVEAGDANGYTPGTGPTNGTTNATVWGDDLSITAADLTLPTATPSQMLTVNGYDHPVEYKVEGMIRVRGDNQPDVTPLGEPHKVFNLRFHGTNGVHTVYHGFVVTREESRPAGRLTSGEYESRVYKICRFVDADNSEDALSQVSEVEIT